MALKLCRMACNRMALASIAEPVSCFYVKQVSQYYPCTYLSDQCLKSALATLQLIRNSSWGECWFQASSELDDGYVQQCRNQFPVVHVSADLIAHPFDIIQHLFLLESYKRNSFAPVTFPRLSMVHNKLFNPHDSTKHICFTVPVRVTPPKYANMLFYLRTSLKSNLVNVVTLSPEPHEYIVLSKNKPI